MRFLNLPAFGEVVAGQGGRFGVIMRGPTADGSADYVIIVPDAPHTKLEDVTWGKYGTDVPGASSRTDGKANTAAMVAAGNTLGLKIQAMEVDGHTDLYLPSASELRALEAAVPDLFEKHYHWSSSQYSAHYAWIQAFENGHSNWLNKGNEFRAVAVRQIPLSHFNA